MPLIEYPDGRLAAAADRAAGELESCAACVDSSSASTCGSGTGPPSSAHAPQRRLAAAATRTAQDRPIRILNLRIMRFQKEKGIGVCRDSVEVLPTGAD